MEPQFVDLYSISYLLCLISGRLIDFYGNKTYQLDRALGYELRGREFESLWAHQLDQYWKNRLIAVFLCLLFLFTLICKT